MNATPAKPITRPASKDLQPELQEYADDRRFATPVTPYARGFDDCFNSRVYANPYKPFTLAAEKYEAGVADASLARAQASGCFCADETKRLDALLQQRGMTADVERVSLASGEVVKRFTIGKVSP